MVIKKDIKKNNEFKKFLELNSLLKIVSILFILSITVLAVSSIYQSGDTGEQNVIVVSGHGETDVKPDTTKFTISVSEFGKDIKSSQEAATNKINEAIVILKQSGVLDKNIKTLNFNTYPKYSSRTSACVTEVAPDGVLKANVVPSVKTPVVKNTNKSATSSVAKVGVVSSKSIASASCVDRTSEVMGYETNQSIEVKITDINKNPNLAGFLVTAVGVVGVQVGEVVNYIDNLEKTKQIVREQAIQKAKVQARDIALSLGIKLGKITSFSENSSGGYNYPGMMRAKMTESADYASAALPVGENKVSSDVSITYSIK